MGVLSVDEVTSAPQVCDWPREPPGVKDLGGNDVQVTVTLAGPVVPISSQVLEGHTRAPV